MSVIFGVVQRILSLRSVFQDVADNVSHPRRLDATMELITYSFVLYLQYGHHDVKCKPSIYVQQQTLSSEQENFSASFVTATKPRHRNTSHKLKKNIYWPFLHFPKLELRCKLQEKLHRVTGPLGMKIQISGNKLLKTSNRLLYLFIYLFIYLLCFANMNINYLSTRTNTNNNRRKQEHSQTNTDTEDRRQGHHNSLEPITVDPWCMHTNKDLQKYQLELHVIRSRNNT